MSLLEQKLDAKLGIIDTNYTGQWSQIESVIDKKLGIISEPEPTFEEKENYLKDILNISEELEMPYQRVIEEYDEIQRQKKEFPFGQLEKGEEGFSVRKLLRNLYDKAKPPPLGRANAGQIYNRLKEGFKGVGHIATEWLVGKKTLGLADVVAAPIESFNDVYLANIKLRKDLESKGLTVTDVGTKYDPTWKITDKKGDVKFIAPNTIADKKFASSIAELYDRIVGLDVTPAEKTWGNIAKIIGIFQGAAQIRGPLPSTVGALGKAGHALQIGLIYGTASELSKGIRGQESYRGTISVLEDGIIIAGLSLIGSGIGGIWQKLKPTEQRKALKLLGLKPGATEKQINAAARKSFLRYHPDKIRGMQIEFEKAVRARNILLNPDYGKDIIYRGRAPSTAKLLMGVTKEGVPIKPAKPPIKIEPAPVVLAAKPALVAKPTPLEIIAPPDVPTTVKPLAKDELVKIIKEASKGKKHFVDLLLTEIHKLPLTDEEFDKFMKEMRPGFVDIEPFVNSLKLAHDWMFTFAEARRMEGFKKWVLAELGGEEQPEFFTKLMESYGKRNAAVEKAISVLKRVVPENLTAEEAMELAIIYEDKRLSPPEGLEETLKGFAGLLDKIEKRSIEEGIFKQTFQERMIAENEIKIEALREKFPEKSKKITELVAENELLREIRYLPHSIVARRTIEAKLAELKGEERKTYLDSIARISAKFKKRTGKLFMKDYLDAGILKPGDIDIRRLTASALADYYYRSTLKSLFDYSIEKELIQPVSDELRKQGWLNQREIGIISPELKGKLVHPLLASSLSEMKEMKLGRGGGTVRQILSMVKIGQFIKPSIVWTYDAVQKYMKGMYSLNPKKEARFLAEATRIVIGKTSQYHQLNEANLYQFPYEVSRNTIEEQIEEYIRQNSPEISRLTKLFEKATDPATGKSWSALLDLKFEDIDIKKMIMTGHRALANTTWTGDKIVRTQSYLVLRNMGYPHDEAVRVAANSHGAYSALSEKYKKALSPITFVYSFRVLMPIEIAKILTEPLIGIPSAFVKGEPIPKYKWNRWAKSWVGATLLPVLTDMYMKERGFEKEGKHLGPLSWKWKKTVTIDGKEQEIIVGINNIINMPVKYWNRITYYNPIRPEARWQQAIERLIKWEIHPLWRIFFWDINENRKSFGTGVNVYDPNVPALKQFGQVMVYVFGQSFRFWGGMMDAVGEGNMTEKERKEQEIVFDEGLNKLDKFLFTVFGYKYIRAPLEERQAIAYASLEKEMKKRIFQDARKYEGKELEKREVEMRKWFHRCEKWIEGGMK